MWLIIVLAATFSIAAAVWVGSIARQTVFEQHVRRLSLETEQLSSDLGQALAARLDAIRAAGRILRATSIADRPNRLNDSMFTSYSTIPATGDRAISSDLQVAILDTAPVWMIGALQQLMIGRRHQISSRQCQSARFRYFRSRPVGADSALNGDNPQTQKRSYN
jgi:hypothetical protein